MIEEFHRVPQSFREKVPKFIKWSKYFCWVSGSISRAIVAVHSALIAEASAIILDVSRIRDRMSMRRAEKCDESLRLDWNLGARICCSQL